MLVGQLRDALAPSELRNHRLGPLRRIDEEPLLVQIDVCLSKRGDRHVVLSFPAVGMFEPMPGMSRPGSRLCQ